MHKRLFLVGLASIALCKPASAQSKISPQSFVGNWTGYWDSRWNMSINVTAVKGSTATVVYTYPEGQTTGTGQISGNVLRYKQISLTLDSASSGQAVGAFSTATRTATVSKQ